MFLLYYGTQHSGCGLSSAEERRRIIPWPAGGTHSNAAEEAVGLHCCKSALLAHVRLGIHKNLNLSAFRSQPPACTDAWGFSSFRCRTSQFPLLSFLRFLFAIFSSLLSHTTWIVPQACGVSTSPPKFGVCKLPEGVLCPVVQVINGDVNGIDHSINAWVQHYWLAFRWSLCHCSQGFRPGSLVFSPSQPALQFVYENAVGGRQRWTSLVEVKTNNVHCSLLIHQASCSVMEAYQVAQAFLLHRSVPAIPSLFCFEYVWKQFPELFAPSSSQGSKWSWLVHSSFIL